MSKPKERPILFSGPMVRAILNGRKTQTRRVVKPQPDEAWEHFNPDYNPTAEIAHAFRGWWSTERAVGGSVPGPVPTVMLDGDGPGGEFHGRWWRSPYGVPGNRLWVREMWAADDTWCDVPPSLIDPSADLWYRAADAFPEHPCEGRGRWRPSIHMPRWASRLTLEVQGVAVQRLQEIHYDGIKAEGALPPHISGGERDALQSKYFRPLWDALNAKRGHGWEANPWVWVVSFRMLGEAETDTPVLRMER